ncbi:hypothetical protein MNO14_15800 [Luteimonas sp. S4-F44]|nr:hypothetical protein [Luteimonas sp. S4-F44]UNK42376.1 hypothetical protein MNO14_15800 [Luteimonas sp. S4-F44]
MRARLDAYLVDDIAAGAWSEAWTDLEDPFPAWRLGLSGRAIAAAPAAC